MPVPLEVTLPVCDQCGRVGPLPLSVARKDHCNGGLKNPHRQIRMKPRKFRLVEDDSKKAQAAS